MNKVYQHTRKHVKPEQVLESFLQIANEKMAEAIRKVSVQHGHNPADYTLLSFGGAGGQHAAALAHLLGSKNSYPVRCRVAECLWYRSCRCYPFRRTTCTETITSCNQKWKQLFTQLQKAGVEKLLRDGYHKKEIITHKRIAFLRFKGQESCVEVDANDASKVLAQFKTKYKSIYGHWLPHREIEVESIRLVVLVKGHSLKVKQSRLRNYKPTFTPKQKICVAGKWVNANVYKWEALHSGASISGPALVVSQNSTSVVPGVGSFG